MTAVTTTKRAGGTRKANRRGLPGAAVTGLFAWVVKVRDEASGSSGHGEQLLHGADEYWNGEHPESGQKW